MKKEEYFLEEDVKLLCIQARSFPDGVMDAFERLGKLVPDRQGRSLFGISCPDEDNQIIYKAGARQMFEGAAEKLGCEKFTVSAGTYTSAFVRDFMNDVAQIGNVFKELLADPRIDPNGCCVEMYVNNKDLRCMVRLDPLKLGEETEAA